MTRSSSDNRAVNSATIVERLRNNPHLASALEYEAADEIERLRAALQAALPDLERNYRFLRDVQAEPARILAANAVLSTVRSAMRMA